jgi:hypothetical protein
MPPVLFFIAHRSTGILISACLTRFLTRPQLLLRPHLLT